MFGHLGAKTGEQERKMRQRAETVRILEAWRGGGTDATSAADLGYPPLKKLQRKGLELPPPPGAPNSTWKLVGLRLWTELATDRDTQHVPEGTWRIFYINVLLWCFLSYNTI